ncbi:MAG TPA: VOC family protein [Thermohalobaculum sp.]|nr:VOC family protein [Thermohalobaculum sp.]
MSFALGYVALAVNEIGRTAALLGDDLGLPHGEAMLGSERLPAFKVGASALVLVPSGHRFLSGRLATGVDHLALTCPDPAAVAWRGDPAPGLNGVTQYCPAPETAAGVSLRLSTQLGLTFTGSPSLHVERIDHIGIASTSNAAAEDLFVGRIGLAFESRQTDMEVRIAVESFTSDRYGVIYHQRPPQPVGGLRVSFITLGDCELEFLQDFDPSHAAIVEHGAAGTTRQDQGAIGRFVAKHGPGLHHIALKTPDIDATLAHLAARGHRLIDPVGRPGSRRGRIGFLHPASTGGVLIHFDQRVDPDRDRLGGAQ